MFTFTFEWIIAFWKKLVVGADIQNIDEHFCHCLYQMKSKQKWKEKQKQEKCVRIFWKFWLHLYHDKSYLAWNTYIVLLVVLGIWSPLSDGPSFHLFVLQPRNLKGESISSWPFCNAAFRLACHLPHCHFDDICRTAQVPLVLDQGMTKW